MPQLQLIPTTISTILRDFNREQYEVFLEIIKELEFIPIYRACLNAQANQQEFYYLLRKDNYDYLTNKIKQIKKKLGDQARFLKEAEEDESSICARLELNKYLCIRFNLILKTYWARSYFTQFQGLTDNEFESFYILSVAIPNSLAEIVYIESPTVNHIHVPKL